jgi:hypothetical protein
MLSAIFDFLYFLAGRICGFLVFCSFLAIVVNAIICTLFTDKYDIFKERKK